MENSKEIEDVKTIRLTPMGIRDNNNKYDNQNIDNYPVGMAYVPWQRWNKVYSQDVGLKRGTIFPELDLPFLGEEVM